MPTYAAETIHEYETFRGTVASVARIGGKEIRSQEKTSPGPYGPEVERFVGPDGQTITVGAVYRRQVIETAPNVFTYGPWVFYGYQNEAKVKGLNALNPNRVVQVAAGQAMKNPHGWLIYLPDGTQPLQPASGELARDEWTGELTGELVP